MYKVIVIDDEDLVREAIIALGKWKDFGIETVLEASNAKDALRIIAEKSPDIIITDMKMPVADGVYLLKELENMQNTSKILVVSGFYDYQYTRQAIQSKVVDYILKPVDAEELNNAISSAISDIEREKSSTPLNVEENNQYVSNKLMFEIEKYIRENFCRDISLEELSQRFYMSKEHISRSFKRQFNTNLFEYINKLRIEKAIDLLEKTCFGIEDIASRVGFSNGNYFSKAFKKHMGCTPSEYRNSCQKSNQYFTYMHQ